MSYVKVPAIGLDTETHLFGAGNLCPKLICLALSLCDNPSVFDTTILSVADGAELESTIEYVLKNDMNKVGCFIAYDLAVLSAHRPDLIPTIFEGLANGKFEDIIIREKLLHLASHGQLEFMELPDGSNMKIGYDLASMAKRYLGKDRKTEKEVSDSWRQHYAVLEQMPVSHWPEDARAYVRADAEDALHIREIQETERLKVWNKIGTDPFATQDFQVAVSYALYLMSAWGFAVDPVAKAEIEKMLTEELAPEKMPLLLSSGVLRPPIPPQPYKNGAKNPDGTPKLVAGKPSSVNKKVLADYIESFAKQNGLEIKRTETGLVSTEAIFFEENAHLDPLFQEYHNRQKLQKLVTTELPRMNWNGVTSPIIHPRYDVLKKTGRTSSYATEDYPSFNVQNVDPRVRGCIVPRPGSLLFSIDYTGMELGTLAQTLYTLFGESVLRDKINANIDCHAYLGSQLAYNLDDHFRQSCETSGLVSHDQVYEAFATLAKSDNPEVKKFYKHYRTFAKPTGLGYPGGLGAETFVAYAKATYGLSIDIDTAQRLRKIWHLTYPEMQKYFDWIIKESKDPVNPDKFSYLTPMGMYRAGCGYCEIANGKGLQSPSAEGAKLSVFNTIRACFDASLCSILGSDEHGPTTRPIGFVHDEIIGEVRDDEFAHDRVYEVARIMVEAMRTVTPDVTPRAQPVLMRRWNKEAEPVFDANKRLVPWEPKREGK